MGEVTLALREIGSFRRLVAIKRLRAEYRLDESFRTMFLEEAKIAGLIRHPNVVPVLDVGVDEGGPYLVMDYVEGVTLSRVVQRARRESRRLPIQVATRVIRSVAMGLAATHDVRDETGRALGLIHRDVSPQNVMLSFDGTVRLTDFGIAKAVDSTKTATGLLKGKTGYMSPEQLRFERPTQCSDLFSLGVVLYELLTCERLYRAEDVIATAQKILKEPAPDLFAARDDAPPELVELCFELLAKDPEHRCQSAREVVDRLGEITDELCVLEGVLRVEDFMNAEFATERQSVRERVQEMVRDWENRRAYAVPSTTPKSPSRRMKMALAAGVLLATGGGGVALWASASGSAATPTSTPLPADTAGPIVEEPSVVPLEPVPTVETAASEENDGDDSAMNVPDDPDEPPATNEGTRRSRRSSRRTRRSAGQMFDALDVIRDSQ